ncbi:hypothetical protein GcM3_197016 [Golovinomyces cichoracearum]|uniref:Uncharacterized protein n=1 Tax=Golovinomyces cichoracearum TaxID=62708 RepID=A0A420HFE2_9PEZI|nr:hypothetical protein GcM3_197016 [Golovinomyces cichoracearum]
MAVAVLVVMSTKEEEEAIHNIWVSNELFTLRLDKD